MKCVQIVPRRSFACSLCQCVCVCPFSKLPIQLGRRCRFCRLFGGAARSSCPIKSTIAFRCSKFDGNKINFNGAQSIPVVRCHLYSVQSRHNLWIRNQTKPRSERRRHFAPCFLRQISHRLPSCGAALEKRRNDLHTVTWSWRVLHLRWGPHAARLASERNAAGRARTSGSKRAEQQLTGPCAFGCATLESSWQPTDLRHEMNLTINSLSLLQEQL